MTKLKVFYENSMERNLALPWYPVPVYHKSSMEIIDNKGELVAMFQEKEHCKLVCKLVNNMYRDTGGKQ